MPLFSKKTKKYNFIFLTLIFLSQVLKNIEGRKMSNYILFFLTEIVHSLAAGFLVLKFYEFSLDICIYSENKFCLEHYDSSGGRKTSKCSFHPSLWFLLDFRSFTSIMKSGITFYLWTTGLLYVGNIHIMSPYQTMLSV